MKSNWFEGTREPCLMRWPGKFLVGSTCDQIAGNIDMLPTFAKLVGVELPKERACGQKTQPCRNPR